MDQVRVKPRPYGMFGGRRRGLRVTLQPSSKKLQGRKLQELARGPIKLPSVRQNARK